MKIRYSVAAVFAAVIAAVLLLRHEGYLHGRVTPGPFRLSGGGVSRSLKLRQTATFGLDSTLDGDPVRIETVKPRFASPGIEILGPRSTSARCSDCGTRWPPQAAGPPLRHHSQAKATGAAVFGVRALQRGVYYVHNMVTLYKRGAKSFASTANADWCVAVGHGKQCSIGYIPPPSVIVEWGGPSKYGVPIRKALGADATTATYPMRDGDRTIALTLSNLSNIPRTLSHVGVARVGGAGGSVTITQAQSGETTIPPREGRRFTLTLHIEDCQPQPAINLMTIDGLEADIDGRRTTVPLSVALAFRTVSAC